MSACPPSTIHATPSVPAIRTSAVMRSTSPVKCGGTSRDGSYGYGLVAERCSCIRMAPSPNSSGAMSRKMVRMIGWSGAMAVLSATADAAGSTGSRQAAANVAAPAPRRRMASRRVTRDDG